MLLPVLAGAKEKAKRTQCLNNLKQLGLAAHIYGTENNEQVPIGVRDPGNDSHILWIPTNTWNAFTNIANERIVDCPNLYPFEYPYGKLPTQGGTLPSGESARQRFGLGYVIGYHYHGGHKLP